METQKSKLPSLYRNDFLAPALPSPKATGRRRPHHLAGGLSRNVLISEAAMTWPREAWGRVERKEAAFIF